MDNTEHIDELIERYISHQLDDHEVEELTRWIDCADSHKDYARQQIYLHLLTEIESNPQGFDEQAALQRFYTRLFHDGGKTVQSSISRKQNRRRWWYAVAAVVIIILIPWASYKLTTMHVMNEFAPIVMEAPNGSQLNVTLPDGTTIKLNSGSRISYSQGFGISDRDITLTGQGFFHVNHNSQMPMRVITGELILQDLGTEFDIRNYADEHQACVNLINGYVALKNRLRRQPSIRMAKGDRVILDKSSGYMKLYRHIIDTASAGIDDMYFENTPLSDVVLVLSRNYGVNIKIDNRVKNIGFYGYFNRKEDTIGKIVEAISRGCEIRYRKDKDTYLLY